MYFISILKFYANSHNIGKFNTSNLYSKLCHNVNTLSYEITVFQVYINGVMVFLWNYFSISFLQIKFISDQYNKHLGAAIGREKWN